MTVPSRSLLSASLFCALLALGCGSESNTPSLGAKDTGPLPGKDSAGLVDTPVLTPDPGRVDPGRVDQGTTADAPQPDTAPQPGGFGYPCDTGKDCTSGFCVNSDLGKVCTQFCIESCPEGWGCQLLQTPGQDPVTLCLQSQNNLCLPCDTDADCIEGGLGVPGDRCVGFGPVEGSFCGTLCAGDGDCPEAYGCEEVDLGAAGMTRQCLPKSGVCSCSGFAVQISARTSCFRGTGNGACAGQRVCTSEGLTDCDAPEASSEICDGVDNDCDGATDEDLPALPCTKESSLGSCSGVTICVNGNPLCDAQEPTEEVCDGADNDCSGGTDEGFDDTDSDGTADCVDPDDDDDGKLDEKDNCRLVKNADQKDFDKDGEGDACDPDDDNDEVEDEIDNCHFTINVDQLDTDSDGQGDACDDDDDGDDVFDLPDNCPLVFNPDQVDTDANGKGDACDGDDDGDAIPDPDDNCPLSPNQDQANFDGDSKGDICDDDDDNDGILDVADNCPMMINGDQLNTDGDAQGDVCDADDDNDGFVDMIDNCPKSFNLDQADADGDQVGDVCDPDRDGDGVLNGSDNCTLKANPGQEDNEGDGVGDVCDPDDDNDGFPDGADNCPLVANDDQADLDGDFIGDLCDNDRDGDQIPNDKDNCPDAFNLDQKDLDGDSQGDLCDPDDDGDGVTDLTDNCPRVANDGQTDTDNDSQGDACDLDDDGDGVCDGAVVPGVCTKANDNCQFVPNPGQQDSDGNGVGDACSEDDDGDGHLDSQDNCPTIPNPDQADLDADNKGDVCDDDDDGDGSPDTVDCKPRNPLVFPGQQEACNGIDDNCVLGVDEENAQGCKSWFYDNDNDGWGSKAAPPGGQPSSRCLCKASGLYRATKGGDCNDGANGIHPNAVETCNNVDDNCDDIVDPEGSAGAVKYYFDNDNDAWGLKDNFKMLCKATGKYRATKKHDCNDNKKSVHPQANEVCNGIDDNCDTVKDPPGSGGCKKFYADNDKDGFGNPSKSRCQCGPSSSYPISGDNPAKVTDCCDSDKQAYPWNDPNRWFGSKNNCGSWDWNCDNQISRRWTDTSTGSCSSWPSCNLDTGWVGGQAGCGQTKKFVTGGCGLGCAVFCCKDPSKSDRSQTCR